MEDNKTAIEQAMELFEQQKYEEAFMAFAKIYNQSTNEEERKRVFNTLAETFYTPNLEDFQADYARNVQLLEKYPYFFGKAPHRYEELTFQLFPVSDELFYCYDKQKDRFSGEYDAATDKQMRYFFKNTDEPLFVENEDNFYNLNYLNDNVRASEDYGGDNHIYLFYETSEPLERLMVTCDLEPVLQQKKFVFLIGEENKERYPVDFKKEFGTDYSTCKPGELAVNDIKRMIWGWKIANFSGTSFLAEIMDFHPELMTIPDCVMESYIQLYNEHLKGKTRSYAISLLKGLHDDDPAKKDIMKLVRYQYNVKMIDEPISSELRQEFDRVSAEEFLTVLDEVLADYPTPDAREWLVGIFLTYSRCHKRKFGRLIPALFLYTHDDQIYLPQIKRDRVVFYFDLVQSFPYHKGISIIRNPVTQCGCAINYMMKGSVLAKNDKGENQLDPYYVLTFNGLLPKDFYFPIQNPLWDSIRVIRFEDLKLNSKAALTSMAEFLNIPLTPSMFHSTWCGLTKEGVSSSSTLFEGFDPAPVYKTYDEHLSVFDKYRIELLLLPLIEAYGYRPKYYDGQQFSIEEVIKLMEHPFLCESIKTIVSEEKKKYYQDIGMNLIKVAISIKFTIATQNFPFDSGGELFAPLIWLRPKEELMVHPLYPEDA